MKGAPLKTTTALAFPPAPNLITALRAGFDAIANHIALILFPIALDLLLWMGPRLRLTQLIRTFADQLVAAYNVQDEQMGAIVRTGQEVWLFIADNLNLFGSLRTYPVGISSLLTNRMPASSPLGMPLVFEILSLWGAALAWLLLTLGGLALGSLYFSTTARIALNGQIGWGEVIQDWPRSTLQVLFLAVFLAILVFVISIPGSFILTLVLVGVSPLGECALMIYTAFVAWVFIPLFFSPHGIFVFRSDVRASLRTSVQLTRATMPMTVLFVLACLLAGWLLNLLWLTPADTSWLMMIGVLGHAFVTTSLLAASFVYYRDAERWTRRLTLQEKLTG